MEHLASRSSSLNTLRPQSSSGPQDAVRALFLQAGIEFNGRQPFDIEVRNSRVFSVIANSGSLGFGESYMAGDWECAQLDEMACRLLAARLDQTEVRSLVFVGLVASGFAIVTANLLGDRPAWDLVKTPNIALLAISVIAIGLLLIIIWTPSLRAAFHFAAIAPFWVLGALVVGWLNYAILRLIQTFLSRRKLQAYDASA